MKTTLQIFINQRFWKEVDTTIESSGYFDFEPAIQAIKDAELKNEFVVFAIRNPQELTSIEIRPLTIRDTERLKK
jgi:hypothetical protein